jgi:hypothetical protein
MKGNPVDTRTSEILCQVAFKAAIDLSPPFSASDDERIAEFEKLFSYLTDSLFSAVRAASPSTSPPAARAATIDTVTEAVIEQFPNSTVEPTPTVEVITTRNGGQQGPLPQWFIEAAATKGVTKVFDNRGRLSQNPKLPWFKSPDDQGAIPFWPPR